MWSEIRNVRVDFWMRPGFDTRCESYVILFYRSSFCGLLTGHCLFFLCGLWWWTHSMQRGLLQRCSLGPAQHVDRSARPATPILASRHRSPYRHALCVWFPDSLPCSSRTPGTRLSRDWRRQKTPRRSPRRELHAYSPLRLKGRGPTSLKLASKQRGRAPLFRLSGGS